MIVSAHDGYPRWLSSGADFLEIDIRRTPDGVFVLSHDELRPGVAHSSLAQVLRDAAGRIGVQLDLKEAGYEIELVRTALASLPPERVVVTSGDDESIRMVKRHFPAVRAGLTRRHVAETTADFIALDQAHLTAEALAFCSRHAIPVWVWTVDDRRQMERLISGGVVAGIITNRPDEALLLRSARS